MSAPPALSIVVVSPAAEPRLSATLASIREQRQVSPEIVMIERPAATAEALNAGIAAARGEWVLFLEAGDRLVGDTVLSEALNWMKRTEAGVAAGEVAYDTGHIVKLRAPANPLARDFLAPAATFYRRALFEENGGFDVSLEAMVRYELHARLWKNRVRFKPIPLRIVAAPTPPTLSWRGCREEMRIRHRYFGAGRWVGWDLVSLLRWARHGFGR